MAGYELNRTEDAVVVRWIATPTRASATALNRDLAAALGEAPGTRALWIVIDTDRTDMPAPDARAVLQENARSLFELARSVDVVIRGAGLRASLIRTLLRTMAVLTRTRDRMRVHEGVDEAARGRRLDRALLSTLRRSA